jgi:hypothetical protein
VAVRAGAARVSFFSLTTWKKYKKKRNFFEKNGLKTWKKNRQWTAQCAAQA